MLRFCAFARAVFSAFKAAVSAFRVVASSDRSVNEQYGKLTRYGTLRKERDGSHLGLSHFGCGCRQVPPRFPKDGLLYDWFPDVAASRPFSHVICCARESGSRLHTSR